MGRLLALLVLVPACGRWGFADHEPGETTTTPDGSTSGDSATANLKLACGSPLRFQIGSDLVGISATPTMDGFAVVTVDSVGILKGWTYAIENSALVAQQQNITLGSNANGTLGLVANGTDLMVASSNVSVAGTTLYGLNANLTQIGTPSVRDGDIAATISVASNGESIAFASQLATTEVDVRLLTTAAADASSVKIIADASKSASNVSLIASGGGYAMAYSTQIGTSLGGEVALLDAGLNIVAGPAQVGTDPNHDAYRPAIAYAPQSDRYLIAWHEKDAGGADNLWAERLDALFYPIGGPIPVQNYATNASVSTDGKDFWLSFRSYDPAHIAPDQLAAAQITSNGVVTPYPINNSGGTPDQWTVTARAGQSVIVWSEQGGSGPDLYFNPMCP